MNDAELRDVMAVLERPAPLPPEFTDRVLSRMIAELEGVAAPRPEPEHRRLRTPRPVWSRPWLTAVAVAAVVALVVGAVTVLSVSRAPSALAALQDARLRFDQLPAYHARTSVQDNDDARDPDLEATWETEDWRQDGTHWRTTVLASSSTAFGGPGDYRVMSPDLYGEYDASTNVFTARPGNELDASSDPSFFFDPSLQWWSTGVAGDRGQPSDAFFEESCTASSSTLIGRAATRLDCDAEPRDIEIWLDDETGLLLRISTFEIVREITSLETDPQMPEGIFDVTPPPGATRRWVGNAAPPAEYRVALGTEVAARFEVAGGRTDGLAIAQVTSTDLWLLAYRCTNRCNVELIRVDRGSGRVLATVPSPAGTTFDDVELVDDELWAAFSRLFEDDPTPASFVQRLDVSTNRLVGDAIETGVAGSGMASADGVLWSTSGQARAVVVGPAQTDYHALARVDVARGEVTQLDLDADAIGAPLVLGDSVWVATTKIRASDPYESDYQLVEVDRQTSEIRQRVAVASWPGSLVTDGRRIFTLLVDSAQQSQIGALDVATGELSSVDLGAPGAAFGPMAVAAGHLWIVSTAEGAVLKVDLATLEVSGSIATGPDPAGVAAAAGSVWVTHVGDGTLVRIDVDQP